MHPLRKQHGDSPMTGNSSMTSDEQQQANKELKKAEQRKSDEQGQTTTELLQSSEDIRRGGLADSKAIVQGHGQETVEGSLT